MIKNKRYIFMGIALLIILCIGTVNATQVTMNVDSKHIMGMGNGYEPLTPEENINAVYVISEREMNNGPDKYILQEYPVSIQDYCKVQIGQKVTLEIPDSRLEVCKIVNIE